MNSMVATEPGAKPDVKHSYHETWAENERMRHVPAIEWITQKVDGDVRRRTGILLDSWRDTMPDDPHYAALEVELRALCRALDRVAEVARHSRANNGGGSMIAKVEHALEHAVANLRSVDPNTFGRRFPFQTFERSKAEPLYAALVVVLKELDHLTILTRQHDGDIDERLLEGLVKLSNPVDARMLRPIA